MDEKKLADTLESAGDALAFYLKLAASAVRQTGMPPHQRNTSDTGDWFCRFHPERVFEDQEALLQHAEKHGCWPAADKPGWDAAHFSTALTVAKGPDKVAHIERSMLHERDIKEDFLINYMDKMGWLPNHSFTFPDGETWHARTEEQATVGSTTATDSSVVSAADHEHEWITTGYKEELDNHEIAILRCRTCPALQWSEWMPVREPGTIDYDSLCNAVRLGYEGRPGSSCVRAKGHEGKHVGSRGEEWE